MKGCHYVCADCIIFPLRSNKFIVQGGLVLFNDGVTMTLPFVPVQSESESRLIVNACNINSHRVEISQC